MPLVFEPAFRKHPAMARLRWLLPGLLLATTAAAQSATTEIDLANLHEDVRGLSQRVGELTLRVEQLEAQNAQLRERLHVPAAGGVTLVQLNEAIANLNRAIVASREDILRQVAETERHGRASAAPAEASARAPAARASAPGNFSDNFPKEGENYTVLHGDTIASIAKKTGAKFQDIINANKLTDPAHIRAGQNLFIPGGK
jgi:LysM repeat protein